MLYFYLHKYLVILVWNLVANPKLIFN